MVILLICLYRSGTEERPTEPNYISNTESCLLALVLINCKRYYEGQRSMNN